MQGHLHIVRPLGTKQKYLSVDLSTRIPRPLAQIAPCQLLGKGVPSSGTRLPEMSFQGWGGWSLLENLRGPLWLPLGTPLTPAPFPVVRELRATRGACRQLVLVQPLAAKGPDARRALPRRWELSLQLCSPGVNSILGPGRPPLPQPRSPSTQPFPARPAGASCGAAEWGWGCRAGGNLFRFQSSQPLPQRARRFGPVS